MLTEELYIEYKVESRFVSSDFTQREEGVVLCACTCCHGECRLVLNFEREVKPSGRAGAEPLGGVQKAQDICWKLS